VSTVPDDCTVQRRRADDRVGDQTQLRRHVALAGSEQAEIAVRPPATLINKAEVRGARRRRRDASSSNRRGLDEERLSRGRVGDNARADQLALPEFQRAERLGRTACAVGSGR